MKCELCGVAWAVEDHQFCAYCVELERNMQVLISRSPKAAEKWLQGQLYLLQTKPNPLPEQKMPYQYIVDEEPDDIG